MRQLYDFQHGTRAGPWSPLMAPNVINLTLDDMVALAAYAASPRPEHPAKNRAAVWMTALGHQYASSRRCATARLRR